MTGCLDWFLSDFCSDLACLAARFEARTSALDSLGVVVVVEADEEIVDVS